MKYTFESISWFKAQGNLAAVVENPSDCNDFSYLIGHVVEIDKQNYYVRGVEKFAHAPPWKKGERIALVTDRT